MTGGGSGIGRSLVEKAAADGAQLAVTVYSEEEAASLTALLPRAAMIATDLSDPQQAQAAVAAAMARLGGIDGFAACAGIFDHRAGLETEFDDLRRTMAINFDAIFVMARDVGRVMKAQGQGSICLVSSQIGLVGHPRAAAYASSKAAVNGLTKALAIELAADHIRVNAVAPGPIATPMTAIARNDAARAANLLRSIPLGRFGTAEEVASVIRFVLSDASAFVTGQIWAVDGGVTAQ